MPRQVFSWGELSPEHRREALDFVAYLLEKRARPLRQTRAGGFSRYRDTSAPLSICRESPEMRPELAGEDALRVHRYMEGHEELP